LSRGRLKCKKGRMMSISLPLIQPHLWDSKENKVAQLEIELTCLILR
jgi:hypothetical protein